MVNDNVWIVNWKTNNQISWIIGSEDLPVDYKHFNFVVFNKKNIFLQNFCS